MVDFCFPPLTSPFVPAPPVPAVPAVSYMIEAFDGVAHPLQLLNVLLQSCLALKTFLFVLGRW